MECYFNELLQELQNEHGQPVVQRLLAGNSGTEDYRTSTYSATPELLQLV
jgi:hypothetical protein